MKSLLKPVMKYIVLGVVFYVIFLFTQMPANKVFYFVEDILDDQNVPLEIYGLSGSVWNGEAKRISYNGQHFNQVGWELHPLAILTGNISASLRYKNDGADASGVFSYGFGGAISAENLLVNIGATEALKMAKIPAVKLGGEFKLNLPYAEFADNRLVSVGGRLLWADAKSMFPQKLDLGSLVVDLTTDDAGVISARLSDGGGPLELGGGLTLSPDGKYNFNGQFSSRDGRNSVLGRALGFMARYDASGKAIMTRTGNVSEFGFMFK